MVVLIVDDSPVMRRIEREVLSRLGGLEVLEAEDGVSAIHEMQSRDFQIDLILLDWVMPRMDGLAFLKLIKSHATLNVIPILMVTSCSDERMMGEAWKAGVDGYLLKPFTRELFLQAILSLAGEDPEEVEDPPEVGSRPEQRGFVDELPSDMRRRILDISIARDYPIGTTIFREGETVDHFCHILEGEVEERQATRRGGESLVRTYLRGECFGVIELMSGDPLSTSFVAARSCKTCRLTRDAFEGMLMKYPEMGVKLSRSLASKARQMEVHEDHDSPGISGLHEILDLPALIQAIELRQKTCVIEFPGADSEICFLRGQIVVVTHGGLEGREAFFRIIGENPENFQVATRPARRARNVHESTTRLLLDCARQMDEQVAT